MEAGEKIEVLVSCFRKEQWKHSFYVTKWHRKYISFSPLALLVQFPSKEHWRMPFEACAFRLEILKSLIDGGSEGYKENVRINSLLEDKAQKMAGLAGVFLTAALAFIKIDTLSVWPFNRLRILIPLSLAIVLLVCCIGFCLAVMWLRSIPEPPNFASLN